MLASVKAIKQYVRKVTAKEIEFKKREMRREVRKATEIVERVMERATTGDERDEKNEKNEKDEKDEKEEKGRTEMESEL